jgi:hypothetical protein
MDEYSLRSFPCLHKLGKTSKKKWRLNRFFLGLSGEERGEILSVGALLHVRHADSNVG